MYQLNCVGSNVAEQNVSRKKKYIKKIKKFRDKT